jgi:hypothetical protein
MFAYLTVVAQQRAYMPQYIRKGRFYVLFRFIPEEWKTIPFYRLETVTCFIQGAWEVTKRQYRKVTYDTKTVTGGWIRLDVLVGPHSTLLSGTRKS